MDKSVHANRYAVDRDAVHRDAVHRDAVHRDAVHRGFVVSYECDVAVNELKLPPCPGRTLNEKEHHQQYLENPTTMSHIPGWGLNFVPVVMRYEFELQEPLADGPRIIAKISRSLDPTFKEHHLWSHFTHDQQAIIENRAAKVVEITPFSALKFDNSDGMWLLCFVHGTGQQSFEDKAPRWTRFADHQVLVEVRSKMQRLLWV